MQLYRIISIWNCMQLLLITLLTASASRRTIDINKIYLGNLLKNLNTTIDPCDDFYQYACGNWANNYQSTLEYVDMPGYMDYKVNKQLLDALKLEHKSNSSIYNKLWPYYQSCVNLNAPALNPYLKLVQMELNLKWPIFREDWNKIWQNTTYFDWVSTIAGLKRYGLNGVFITQNVNVRLMNGSHYIIELHSHQPKLLEFHQSDVAVIFENFGMSKEQSANVTVKIIELEQKLKDLTLMEYKVSESGVNNDTKYLILKEMTVQQLIEAVPNIDWHRYLSISLARDVNVNAETVLVYAHNLVYFNELLPILNNTSNETIAYYIMLKFMYKLNDDLPTVKDKSMQCVAHLRGYMPLAMNYLYEEHFYKSKRKASDKILIEIYNKLRSNFEELIKDNYLELNASEQAYILTELRTMKLKIGNIPQPSSSSGNLQAFVENYYVNITTNASNFYVNHLQLLKFNNQQQQAKLLNQHNAQHFYAFLDIETSISSSPVKLFDNAILAPYGYLQMPLFQHELNSLFQYSLLGFILSHEIIHAFDLFHIVFDQHGNYNDMGVAVAQHFLPYIDCFAPPNASLGSSWSENMADDAGLRLVYHTFFDDVVNNLNSAYEFTSTHLNYTSQQLFFINSVQFLCADMSKIATMDVKSMNLEHDMHHVRVAQNWANFEQFAESFQCGNDTKMHPAKKCRLW